MQHRPAVSPSAEVLAACLTAMVVLAGASAVHAQSSRDADARRAAEDRTATLALARAERALARGRRAQALTLLEASVRRLPRDPRAALRLCELLVPESEATVERVVAGDDADAARCEASLRLVTLDPGAPDAELEDALVWARALSGDRGPALSRLASRPLDERDIPALAWLAALAVAGDALEEADTALSLARRVRPNDLGLASDLAAVRLAMGDAASAVLLFRAVAIGHPDDRDALHDLAGACLEAGEHASAVRYLEQLAAEEPERVERWIELARARTELGTFEAAARDARRAVTLSASDDPRASLALGDALRLEGDAVAARAAYEEALRRDPRSVRAQAALSSLDRTQ